MIAHIWDLLFLRKKKGRKNPEVYYNSLMISDASDILIDIGVKPLIADSHPALDTEEQTSSKFESKYKQSHSKKCIRKCRLQYCSHFVQTSVC